MIEVIDLHKQWGDVAALRGVSFQAADGAITGLLGANGAGKTTALRILTGIATPQRGEVRVAGGLGALLDHNGLYGRLTARENIAYFGELQGLSGPALRERLDEAVAQLDIRAFADRRASTLSLGERMRTALGRAIVHAPQNLILDEPTNGLDVPSVRSLRTFLRKLRDRGRCVLFSSHVLEEVRALCDRLVILSHGNLVAQGTPEEICSRTGCPSLEDAFVHLTDDSHTKEESCEVSP
jgi:sodium transport system ATP-binding protein